MAQDAEPNTDSSWQQRAVDRSLGTARARAVSRSGQILAAARDLTEETGGLDFTVQDIVDRSGLSLRSFYKHFGGKDELLLALLEEILQDFADDLRRDVEVYDDPVDRLRVYITNFHKRVRTSPSHGGRAFSGYHVRMLEFRRDEFASAIEPQVKLLREIVESAMATGRIRTDLSATDVTALLTVTLMSAAQMSLLDVELTESPLQPDQLWAWCAAAVGADVPTASTTGSTTRSKPTKRTASSPAKGQPKASTTSRPVGKPRSAGKRGPVAKPKSVGKRAGPSAPKSTLKSGARRPRSAG